MQKQVDYSQAIKTKYPEQVVIAIARDKAGKALKESGREPNNPEEVNRMMSNMMSVPSACTFYAELVRDNKEVAYYGETVTAEDAEAVLMRWEISDDRYRVIFGDLRIEDATVEKLAELEQSIPK